jgi:hypothetical protein
LRNRQRLSAQSHLTPCAIKKITVIVPFFHRPYTSIHPKHKDVSPKTSLCFE